MNRYLLSEVSDKIKTGDLLAFSESRINGFVSFVLWCYQKCCHVKFSHVGIAMWLGNRLFVVEATWPKIAITPISNVEDVYLISTNLEHANDDTVISFLMDHVGEKYGIIELITNYIGWDFLPYARNGLYCSTFASALYFYVGHLDSMNYGITPQSLVETMLEREGIEEPIHIITDRGNL